MNSQRLTQGDNLINVIRNIFPQYASYNPKNDSINDLYGCMISWQLNQNEPLRNFNIIITYLALDFFFVDLSTNQQQTALQELYRYFQNRFRESSSQPSKYKNSRTLRIEQNQKHFINPQVAIPLVKSDFFTITEI